MAESELVCIRILVDQSVGYEMCQSKLAEILEKVLKAELIRSGWFLERTHDLERLRKEPAATSIDPLPGWFARRRRSLAPAREIVDALPSGPVVA